MAFDPTKKIGYEIIDGIITHERDEKAWEDWMCDDALSPEQVKLTHKRGHQFVKQSVTEQGELIAQLYKSDPEIKETTTHTQVGYNDEDGIFYGVKTTLHTSRGLEEVVDGVKTMRPKVSSNSKHSYYIKEELKTIEQNLAALFSS